MIKKFTKNKGGGWTDAFGLTERTFRGVTERNMVWENHGQGRTTSTVGLRLQLRRWWWFPHPGLGLSRGVDPVDHPGPRSRRFVVFKVEDLSGGQSLNLVEEMEETGKGPGMGWVPSRVLVKSELSLWGRIKVFIILTVSWFLPTMLNVLRESECNSVS